MAKILQWVNYNGTSYELNGVAYAVCSTAGSTAAKVVDSGNDLNFILINGAKIAVRFTDAITATSPTLKVGDTLAKPIIYNGTALEPDTIAAGQVVEFVYDSSINSGTGAWLLVGGTGTGSGNSIPDGSWNYRSILANPSDLPTNHEAGAIYKISTAGTYAGQNCEAGDLIVCIASGSVANDNDWVVLQQNVDVPIYRGSNSFADGQLLFADGNAGQVKAITFNPTLTIGNGSSVNSPTLKMTIANIDSNEVSLPAATINSIGVVKLTNTVSNIDESNAATPKLVSSAIATEINALDVTDTAESGKYVSTVSETNGQIAVTKASFNPSVTVTQGDAINAPTINITVGEVSGTAQGLPAATITNIGVVKLDSNSNSGSKTKEDVAVTPKGVWAAIGTLDGSITGTPAASKTFTAFNESDGVITGTIGDIAIAASQITTPIADIQAGKDAAGNTITTTYATKTELNNLLATASALVFKGTLVSASGLPNNHTAGWTYLVTEAGTYAGKPCEVGDLLVCITDGTVANNNDWTVVQYNVDTAVYRGANSFTDGYMIVADNPNSQSNGKVKAVAINTTLSVSGSSSSSTDKIQVTVGNVSSSQLGLTAASTSAYGETILSNAVNSIAEDTAATSLAVKTAYDLAASKTDNIGTITGVTAGTGLSGGGSSGSITLNHSNSVTANSTAGLYKIAWDAQGHITSALTQNITDNSSNADVTSIDENLITARTLYYQLANKGYTTNTGTVTQVSTGGGLTGGPITTTGTISHATSSFVSTLTNSQIGSTTEGGGRTYLQTMTFDDYGHIIGYLTATDDANVTVALDQTNKTYLTGVTTAPTATAQTLPEVADTNVYVTAGQLNAPTVRVAEAVTLQYNSTTKSLDFIFA